MNGQIFETNLIQSRCWISRKNAVRTPTIHNHLVQFIVVHILECRIASATRFQKFRFLRQFNYRNMNIKMFFRSFRCCKCNFLAKYLHTKRKTFFRLIAAFSAGKLTARKCEMFREVFWTGWEIHL